MATYIFEGTINVAIWALKAGAWQVVGNDSVSVFQRSGTGGTQSFSFVSSATVQFGSGVQAFGLSIASHTVTSAAITAFSQVRWQAQGSSVAPSSATPNGQKGSVTVRP
jgi:L-asparaginase II